MGKVASKDSQPGDMSQPALTIHLLRSRAVLAKVLKTRGLATIAFGRALAACLPFRE